VTIPTARSVTYERATAALWWVGWVLVCVSISSAIALVAYDTVLQ
jgi:hypothetical protein